MVSPALPEAATATVTLAAGAADRSTPKTSLVPWATENVPGSASSVAGPLLGELVGDDDGDADAVGEEEGEALGDAEVVLGEGLGEAVPPLQATPLRVKAVGAVLV